MEDGEGLSTSLVMRPRQPVLCSPQPHSYFYTTLMKQNRTCCLLFKKCCLPCLGFLYKNKTQPKTRPLPDQRRAAGTGAQQTECVPGGGWGATERPLPHAPQAAGLPLLMPSSQKTGEVGGPIFTCSVGAMHHRVVTRPGQYWPDASSALCSCPGRGSSFPSRHLSGSPAAGTTGQHRLCSGWQSPPWAGGSH